MSEEKNNEKTVCVNIENYTGDKPVEVIIRKGEAARAADPLPTKTPIKTNISGVISTPFDWLEKRIDTIDQKRARVFVDRESMNITLTVNENDEYTKGTITGTVEFTEIFKKTRINSNEAWIPERLGQFLRLNRSLFADRQECMRLVSALKNFTANAKSEVQKQKDPNGSRVDVFRQQVESNLPKDFTVNLAIFKGTPKVPIVVEFDHYLADGDCYLQLVSPGANEAVEDFRDKCIDDVLNQIRTIAPDIAIMEN